MNITFNDFYLKSLQLSHSNLLDELHTCHMFLRSFKAAKTHLISLQEKLLNHFTLQRNDFYEQLSLSYAHDDEVLKTINLLREDLKLIKMDTITFFDQCGLDQMSHHMVNFPVVFSHFEQLLKIRIKNEDEKLIPLLCNGKG